jgi:acyl-CoA synthetase (AMP-forming)/AMP-acid ligase II
MAGDPRTVRELIEGRAATCGAAPYLIAPSTTGAERRLDFPGLERSSLGIAQLLADHGIGAGDHVAFLEPNGVDAVELFLAVMAAGAVVTPLSLLLPPDALASILERSRCRLLLAGSGQVELARRARAALARKPPLVVTTPGWQRELGGRDWPLPAPDADDDALLMYTSGTTGRPKGVRLSHRNLLAGARFVTAAHALTATDRVLAVLPLYHINAQVVTVLAPLLHGGSVVMPERFSTSRFWPLAARHRCTWLNVVPTMIAYLLNGTDAVRDGLDLKRVRFCRSASAPLPPAHQRAFEQRFGIPIVETMGLTETAGPVFSNLLDRARRKLGSPGQAFGNVARITDPETGMELPPGEAGEIEIKGQSVMVGYLDDADATARALRTDGWLRTGDLGYRDDDGFYFVTGRLKELIIKGGENIAPREIDEVLLRHPALMAAAAVGVPDPAYGQEIEAGVVVKPGAEVSEAELLDFCRGALGAFRTPRAIRFLAELPQGPSGKLQRLRLLSPEVRMAAAAAPPSGAVRPSKAVRPSGAARPSGAVRPARTAVNNNSERSQP